MDPRPLLLLALVGCGAPHDAERRVVKASLRDQFQVNLALLAGASLGTGVLEVTYADGSTGRMRVVSGAGQVGALGEFSVTMADATTLRLPSGGVRQADLLGRYEGSVWSVALGPGLRRETVRNPAGARLDAWTVGLGTGLYRARHETRYFWTVPMPGP